MVNVCSPAPTIGPFDREAIPPADSYHDDDLVWVWRSAHGKWLPGEVEATGPRAVRVRYEGGGTAVDTVMPEYVMPRDDEPDRPNGGWST